MAYETLTSDVKENIAYITLNRPERMNSFDMKLGEELYKALHEISKKNEIRAVVLRGTGKGFCGGGDVKEMYSDVQEGKDMAAYFRAPLAAFNKMTLSITKIPKPVLAAVHGAVAGVAFNLMLGCDFRIAKEGTRFTQAFVKLGLSPDGGGTYFLPRLVGYARACELSMLPTEIDAKTALEWDLINHLYQHSQVRF